MTYKLAILDDSVLDGEYIKRLALAWAGERKIALDIAVFPSAEAFLFDYADHKDYEILLLDIEMKAINGVQLAMRLRAENASAQIAFITGYPDFMAEGYEVGALNYLIKPVSADKLASVLDRAVKNLGKIERSIIFSTGGEAARVRACDIISVEAFAHYCSVSTVNGKFDAMKSISEMEKLLGEGFARCHRSYIVSIRYIKRISIRDITMDDDAVIPLSRSKRGYVNQAFIRYFKGDV